MNESPRAYRMPPKYVVIVIYADAIMVLNRLTLQKLSWTEAILLRSGVLMLQTQELVACDMTFC